MSQHAKACPTYRFSDKNHSPREDDLDTDGFPRNSMVSNLRVCMDARGDECQFYCKYFKATDFYSINQGLCLYAYKNA